MAVEYYLKIGATTNASVSGLMCRLIDVTDNVAGEWVNCTPVGLDTAVFNAATSTGIYNAFGSYDPTSSASGITRISVESVKVFQAGPIYPTLFVFQ